MNVSFSQDIEVQGQHMQNAQALCAQGNHIKDVRQTPRPLHAANALVEMIWWGIWYGWLLSRNCSFPYVTALSPRRPFSCVISIEMVRILRGIDFWRNFLYNGFVLKLNTQTKFFTPQTL